MGGAGRVVRDDMVDGATAGGDFALQVFSEECALADAHASDQHQVARGGFRRVSPNQSEDSLAADKVGIWCSKRAVDMRPSATLRIELFDSVPQGLGSEDHEVVSGVAPDVTSRVGDQPGGHKILIGSD